MRFKANKKTALISTCAALTFAAAIASDVEAKPRQSKTKPHRAAAAQMATPTVQPDERLPVDIAADIAGAYAAAGPVDGRRNKAKAARARQAGTQPPRLAFGIGGSDIIAEARRHLGTNPTGRSSLWCARFLNMVLERSGRHGTGSDMASSFASYGRRVSGPQVGAIAVMSRGKRGGHVGIVTGIDESGNPVIISGNHGKRVAETAYSRGRIYAYVMP